MRGLDARLYGGPPWSHLPWIWHALWDGTRLCGCPHSHWIRGGPGPREVRDPATGRTVDIVYDGPRLPGPARSGTGARGHW